MSVAVATPSMPQPSPSTNHSASTMLSALAKTVMRERRDHALHAEQPADHDVLQKRAGRAPDADVEIAPRELLDLGAGVDQRQRDRRDDALEQDDERADRPGDQQSAQEDRAHLAPVARAVGLRHEPGRAHAQETEAPIDVVEDERADRDAADIGRVGQMAHDAGVDGAEQRHRQVRQDDREGEAPDPPIRRARHGRGSAQAVSGALSASSLRPRQMK